MAGVGESSASAVMVAPHIQPRSRMPWVIAIVAVVGALGIAVGVVFSRPSAVVQTLTAATQAPTHVEPTAAPPPSQTQATVQAPPTQSAAQAPSASASHHHSGPATTTTTTKSQTHTGPAGSGNDLNSLLDTR
jgi:hypothetical protein